MAWFAVTARCGHVGRKNYARKTFAIEADSGKTAAKVVRGLPRVKHHHRYAIIDVEKVNYERYLEIIEANNADPYFHCHSVQEQRKYIDNDIYPEEMMDQVKKRVPSIKEIFDGKMKIRSPKKYVKNNYYEEGWAY